MRRAVAALGGLALAVAAGCGEDAPALRLVVDTPPETNEAWPFASVDSLELSVARAGADTPLASVTGELGDGLELRDVPFGEELVVHLVGRFGEVEAAYGRTCAFSVPARAPSLEVHLFLSRIVKWAPAPGPATPPPAGASAFALPDGSAAFFGGTGPPAVTRFDPVAGAFETIGDVLVTPRRNATVTALGDGRALVVGGLDESGDAVAQVGVLSPLPPRREETRSDGPALSEHAALLLGDGSVLVTGGALQPGPGQAAVESDRAFLFRFGSDGILAAPLGLAGRMASPRAGHTMTPLPGGSVLLVGGRDATGAPVPIAEVYRPLSERFDVLPGAALKRPRFFHRAVRLRNDQVLVLGGVSPDLNGTPVPVTDLEVFDPVTGEFRLAGTLPAGAGVVGQTVTVLPDRRVLVAGGFDASGVPVDTVLVLDVGIEDQVVLSPTDRLAQARAGHGAVMLCDGTILLAGGGPGAERYNPTSRFRRSAVVTEPR